MAEHPPADDTAANAREHEPVEEVPSGPQERLSLVRVAAVLVVALLVAGGITLGVKKATSQTSQLDTSWSVPYVDVTLTPTYQFQNPESNPARDIALAFVVADHSQSCTPSWGGAYTLDQAATQLELDRRITQLRAAGGDIMVSFGGQANKELALVCQDEAALTDAYRSVVSRYHLHAIDLDIENADLTDQASIERRARAIATVQTEQQKAGTPLAVWLTLPAGLSGLTADGVALVTATLKGGVDLTGVNAMTMNFGSVHQPTADMLAATKSSLEAAATQIGDIYRVQGVTLDAGQRWSKLGATPMIGQNDVVGEVFTLDDAKGLADFAMAKGLGRVSTWSLNRDGPCSPSFADVTVLSNTCSSVKQEALDFAQVFTSLPGRSPSTPSGQAVTVTDPPQVADDPAASPYPIWRPEAQYPGGYKVVRKGMVYEAKWYTTGIEPSGTSTAPDFPWALVGPVSPNDEPYTPITLVPATYALWSPTPLYAKGDRVTFDGLPYEARWPNQAEAPSTLFPVGPDSAWKPLFDLPGEPVQQ